MESRRVERSHRAMDTQRGRARRRSGFSMTEMTFSILLLGVGMLGSSWMTDSAEISAAKFQSRSQGVAIAHGQSDIVQGLPYQQLAPTPGEGFAPAPWIAQPGFDRGKVPVQIWADGVAETADPVIYSVSYRSRDADRSGRLRRVEVRVEWQNVDQSTGHFTIETVRAG
jgi:hypothetical protein